MGIVTFVSTSLAEAPGKTAVTLKRGSETMGMPSTFVRRAEKTPMPTMARVMTLTTT
jgi:hypothetical protein